jgi:hypothetical protein
MTTGVRSPFLNTVHCAAITVLGVFDGPINGECFRAYVEQQLVPVLKPATSSSWISLGSHQSAEVSFGVQF